MTPSLLLTFATYAFVTSITPGPNNAMVLASGLNFGFRRTIPHLLGINLGFSAMVLAVGLGLGGVFSALPVLHDVLRYVGALYLVYLAWKIAGSGTMSDGAASARPMSFMQAAAFQWVNPKAWIMAIGAVATYTPQNGFFLNIAIVTAVFAIINAPCIAAWAGFGVMLRRLLTGPRSVRIFNVAMAALLVLSLYPLVLDSLK
ncbi:MAG: LysE family translocator [Rhizobiales bacterium]|nr:LysE family translocator [Hyphomicrobiales bacterium]